MVYVIIYGIIQKYSKQTNLFICSMVYSWVPSSTALQKKAKPKSSAAQYTYQVHNDWWLKNKGENVYLRTS